MIFMAINRLALEVEWLDYHGIYGLESEFFCNLTIRLDGKSLTASVDQEGKRRDYISVSAMPLANGSAAPSDASFTRLGPCQGITFLSWSLSDLMAAIGDGYVWPDIRFGTDGKNVLIRAQGQLAEDARVQRIRFLADAEACPSA